jgi:hypothetical protein
MSKKIELPDELALLHARCLALGEPEKLVDGLISFYTLFAQARWAVPTESEQQFAERRARDDARAKADEEFAAVICPDDAAEHQVEIRGDVPAGVIEAATRHPSVYGWVQHSQQRGRLRLFLRKKDGQGRWLRPDGMRQLRADVDDAIRQAHVPGEYVFANNRGVS